MKRMSVTALARQWRAHVEQQRILEERRRIRHQRAVAKVFYGKPPERRT